MIYQILPIIVEELNGHIQRRLRIDPPETKVILGNLMSPGGTLNDDLGEDKIICSLVNIQEEEIKPALRTNNSHSKNPPVFLNLSIMFAAYFKDYITGLKFLSAVVGFFQGKTVFTAKNTPAMSQFLSKINVEIVNLDARELSSVWSMIGAKYMPSILYRFKIISIDEDMIINELTPIREIQSETT